MAYAFALRDFFAVRENGEAVDVVTLGDILAENKIFYRFAAVVCDCEAAARQIGFFGKSRTEGLLKQFAEFDELLFVLKVAVG